MKEANSMKVTSLKEAINYIKEMNKGNEYLEYNLEEGTISLEWYKAILEEVKKYNPKRVIDIGSNVNMFGYLFANEGIEYIGVERHADLIPIENEMIKFINKDYYEVREEFKNDIIISCLCVGYLIPIKDIKAKVLIINDTIGKDKNYKCIARRIELNERVKKEN